MARGKTAYLLVYETDRGRARENNEDSIFAARLQQGTGNPWELDLVAVVADGMGGHVAGAQASQMATDLIGQHFTSAQDAAFRPPRDMIETLKGAFVRVNDSVRVVGMGEGFKPAGTTLLLACMRDSTYWIGHVGDSRAYLVTPNDVVRLTEDHSWVAEQVRQGLMTGPEAEASPFRNQLTQAIGTSETLDVDTHTGDLGPGSALVLCTDGLTEYVMGDEIADSVRSDPESATKRLIALANARGGDDNISVVVVAHPSLANSVAAGTSRLSAAARRRRTLGGTNTARATTKDLPAAEVKRLLQRRRIRRGVVAVAAIVAAGLVVAGAIAVSRGSRARPPAPPGSSNVNEPIMTLDFKTSYLVGETIEAVVNRVPKGRRPACHLRNVLSGKVLQASVVQSAEHALCRWHASKTATREYDVLRPAAERPGTVARYEASRR